MDMALAGHLWGMVQALQIVPAALHGDRATQSLAHPGRHESPGPQRLPTRWGAEQRHAQLLLSCLVQERRAAIGVGAGAIAHPTRPFAVITLGQLADPIRAIAGALRHLSGTLSTREEPQDLPPTTLMGLMCAAIALL